MDPLKKVTIMTKPYILSALLLFSLSVQSIVAQSDKIGTIKIAEVKSNYPIVANTTDLQFLPTIHQWHYCNNIQGEIIPDFCSDTIFVYRGNQIYAGKYYLSYIETNNEIRLEYILLSKNKKFWMEANGQILQYKTSLEKVLELYNYNGTEIQRLRGPLFLGNKLKLCSHYKLCFNTGEPHGTRITLTFNRKKKLISIHMDYYHDSNLMTKSMFE